MKVGDKLYCKKDVEHTSIKTGWICSIEYIDNVRITLTYDYQTRYYFNFFYNSENNVNNYFYTEKQMRKLKLEKIYETNLR